MRHVFLVLLLVSGSTGILVTAIILSPRYFKQEEFDRLPAWQRLTLSNALTSMVGLAILAWDGLLFWLLW